MNGAFKLQFIDYPFRVNSNLLVGDPTENEISQLATSNESDTIQFQSLVSFPEGRHAIVEHVFAILKWTGKVDVGVGSSVWYIIDDDDSPAVGGLISAYATAVAITSESSSSIIKNSFIRSGLVRKDALPASGDFFLVLAGRGVAGSQLTSTVFDTTTLEIGYKRT